MHGSTHGSSCIQMRHKSPNRLCVQLVCVHSFSVHIVVHTPTILQLCGGYRMAVPLDCTMHGEVISCIRSSSTGFSIRMFLRSQICPICENLTTFSKVPNRFSISWNSEYLSKLQPYMYAIMDTLVAEVGVVFGTLTYPYLILPYSSYYGHLASHYGGHRCSPFPWWCNKKVSKIFYRCHVPGYLF
jgi:hypothetical protein